MSTQLQRAADLLHAPGGDSVYIISDTGAAQAITLTKRQRNVDVRMSTNFDIDLTLPNAQDCKGLTFTVFLSAFAGSNDLTVTGPGVGSSYASGDLDAAGEWVMVYSDGFRWLQVSAFIGGVQI